jgi:hypothetical protein
MVCRWVDVPCAARTKVSTKDLMARMGHDSPRAALIYQHAISEADKELAAGLDGLIARVRVPGGENANRVAAWRALTEEQREAIRQLAVAMPEQFGPLVLDDDEGEAGALVPAG